MNMEEIKKNTGEIEPSSSKFSNIKNTPKNLQI